jgi:Aspartyl protease
MPSQRLAVVLACFLVSQGAIAQIRRQGPPPKPYSGFEMSSPVIEVPMLAGDEVLLEVRVDGKGPYRFALDTGAARGGRIDGKLAKALGLPVVGRALTGDPTGKNRQDVEIVQARTLTLGGASFRDVELLARDFQSGPGTTLDGVLGIGLFKELLLTLDYPARRVRLETGELPLSEGHPEVLDFTDPHGVPEIALKIGDVELRADVDSGNMKGEVVLPASYIGKVPLEKAPEVVGHGRTSFNEFEIKQAPLKGALHIAGQTVENVRVDFVEIFPQGNLGAAFLRRFVVTIDGKNHRLRLRGAGVA